MAENNKTVHIPVLLKEVINSLELKKTDIVFDGTLGGGGYSEEILKINIDGKLIGTDLDENALKKVKERLKIFSTEKKFFQKNYSEIKNILEEIGLKKIDKAVLDLGISSDQLEILGRGISFKKLDDPLDMNLSTDENLKKMTASEILNSWTKENLADIFFYYGGEKASKMISKAIIEKREEKKIEKVSDLVEIIEEKIGIFYKNKKIHPATKIFQALRITVNDEIGNLKKALSEIIDVLEKDGRLAVVTFHSLEDKTVKKFFRELEDNGVGKRFNKKVIKPTFEEVQGNKRARSGKLRVFQKG